MKELQELYFERGTDWYEWLLKNHDTEDAVYLIFYKLELNIPTMRWEEAVKVALCFGWIDSTVKSLGNGKRRQYFSKRNPKSSWSALNKKYIKELESSGLIHESGYKSIDIAKENGAWTAMDAVENGVIPDNLQKAFDQNPVAYENFKGFAKGYQKGYLSWLHSAKREATKEKRITEIIKFCEANVKSRDLW